MVAVVKYIAMRSHQDAPSELPQTPGWSANLPLPDYGRVVGCSELIVGPRW